MKETNFLNDVWKLYTNVKIKKEVKDIYQINTLVYYLADSQGGRVQSKDVYEIDIRAAFPSICKLLFKEETEFLSEINRLKDDKRARNIFIATTLKGTEYLKHLNLIAKMIISSTLFDYDPEAEILELKKDGIVYIGQPNIKQGKLYQKYSGWGFQIRQTKYPFYLRYQKTSNYLTEENELIIKGLFKDRPKFLKNIGEKLLVEEDVDFENLNKVYSNKYFQIIKYNILDELFVKYYLCDGNKYLNNQFKYNPLKAINQIDNILPKNYLKLFIYPILVGIKELKC